MRAKALLSLAGAFIAAVALVSASGAATTKAQKVTKIDVSTRAAVVHYLRSIHVSPKGAVVQRGLRNYAGAHCPGTHWTCASTKHTVVQIAKRGGQNRFLCKASKCVVVQISEASHGVYAAGRAASATGSNKGGNSGYCVKTGSGALAGGGQTCSITQTGNVGNTAGIYENSNKVSGVIQSQQYVASITQTSSGAGNNTACVTQNVSQDGSTSNTNTKGVAVSLQAIQSIAITQNTLTGNNTAINGADSTTGQCTSQTLTQSQTQTSSVSTNGNITQTENPSVSGLKGGNVSLDIEQNQDQTNGFKGNATGANSAVFSQTTNQTAIANAKNGATVSQTENFPDGDGVTTPFSGIVGTVNQDSKGQSTATVTQSETQCEDAVNTSLTSPLLPTQCSPTSDVVTGITLTQTENGPVGLLTPRAKSAGRVPYYHKGIGTSAQTGAGSGVVDSFNLTQHSNQYTDKAGPGVTVNQANTMQGDCASSGNGSATGGSCAASQQATLNGVTSGTTADGYTAGSISQLLISCPNGHNSCTATPPPAPVIQTTPAAQTTSTSANFTWTEAATAGVTLKCSIDGGSTFNTCDTPTSTSYTGLSHGPHTFVVKAVDNTASHNESDTDSFSWEIIPYLTFETTNDGALAGWSGTPGLSSITLTTGSDPGTYAQFTIHDSNSLVVDALAEPTFTTDTFSGGAPRYEIDFADGDYAFGYPAQQGWGSASWDLNCGQISCVPMSHVTWSAIQWAETGQTVTDALIEADFPVNATYHVTDFTFDGYPLSFFTN